MINYEKKPTPQIVDKVCKNCRGKLRDFEVILAADGICMKCKLKDRVKNTEGQLIS